MVADCRDELHRPIDVDRKFSPKARTWKSECGTSSPVSDPVDSQEMAVWWTGRNRRMEARSHWRYYLNHYLQPSPGEKSPASGRSSDKS